VSPGVSHLDHPSGPRESPRRACTVGLMDSTPLLARLRDVVARLHADGLLVDGGHDELMSTIALLDAAVEAEVRAAAAGEWFRP
jgi:hypothetical protein